MERRLLTILILVALMVLSTACKEQKAIDHGKIQESSTDNKGSITFTNIERSQLEEDYNSDYWVFTFYVEEKSGMSRREIYDRFLNGKFNEVSYLSGGMIVGTAKDILDLKSVEGMDIVMTEYFYENYFVDKEYIEKFEADTDIIYVNLKDISAEKAYEVLGDYEIIDVIIDHSIEGINREYVKVKVNKEELGELFDNDSVACMRKRRDIGVNQHAAWINDYVDNSEGGWPEK